MRNRTEWKFSDAALRVDFSRIIREAERALSPMPAVLRITIDAKHVVTLAHREAFDGFIANGAAAKVDRVLEAPAVSVNEDLKVVSVGGTRGCVGQLDDEESEWIAIFGDFVGELSDRVEVKVEVF